MRVTIIPSDTAVSINGKTHTEVDFSKFPKNIHAIQWYETWGEIEYVVDSDGVKPSNDKITSLDEYSDLLDQWEAIDIRKIEEYNAAQPTKEQIVVGKRNALLAGSDWTQVSDNSLTEEQREAWRVYRQALRDITDQPDFPEVVFPSKPSF